MTIRHHPDEILLARHAAGGLEPAMSLVVRAHLHRCAACRADLAALEAAGGALLDDLPMAPLTEGALARTLAMLDRPPPAEPAAAAPARRPRHIGMGIRYRPLLWERRFRAYELTVPAGRRMPVHSHSGAELTCILQGAFRDETGLYETGDFVAMDSTRRHSPRAENGPDCVCIIASDGPLRMHGLVSGAIQAVLRL